MKTQLKTLLLLAIVLGVTILYSRHTSEIVFNLRLVKPNFHFFNTTVLHPYHGTAEKEDAPIPSLSPKKERETSSVDSTRHTILFFGDSMLEGLCKRFIDYAVENGHDLHTVIWYSSTTQIWAETDTLQYFINKYHPTFLITCLGGNELSVRDLDRRDEYIKAIIKKMDHYPFVWISPPNWKEDTGINDLIIKRVGTTRYFDSRHLNLERGSDHAHPTYQAAAIWMDSVATWLSSQNTAHRLLMKYPRKHVKSQNVTVLMPLR